MTTETGKRIKIVKITKWNAREAVEVLGDVSGLIEEPVIETVLSGRRAVVRGWFDVDGNGFEETTVTLHDWEL